MAQFSTTSQLILDASVKTEATTLQFFIDLVKQIEKADLLLPQTVAEMQSLLRVATQLARTPFMNQESMAMAAQSIQKMTENINKTREEHPSKALPQSTVQDLNLFTRGYETSLKRINDLEAARNKESEVAVNRVAGIQQQKLIEQYKSQQNYGNLIDQLKREEESADRLHVQATLENQNRNMAYAKMQATAIQENTRLGVQASKDLIRLEDQRQALLARTYAQQRKSISQPDFQQRFLTIAEQISSAKLSTPEGLAQYEQAKSSLQKVTAELVQQQAQLGVLGRAWEKFRTVFQRVFDALIAFVLINWTQRIFVGFFESLIKSNQLLETLQARFASLIPNAVELQSVWKTIQQVTITTPFKVEDILNASIRLRAFGVDIKDNLRAITDWAAGIGKDLDDIATRFGKIVNYSPRTALLLSTSGFSMAAFDAYVARFGDRTIALNKLISDQFGGTAARVSSTFQGMLTNISDLWTFISQKVGEPLFTGLKEDIRFVFDMLNKVNNTSGKTLSSIGEVVNFLVRSVGIVAVSGLFAVLIAQSVKFISALKLAGTAWTVFKSTIVGGVAAGVLGALVIQYFELKDAIQRVIDIEKELKDLPTDAYNERISKIREENEALQEQLKWYNQLLVYASRGATIIFAPLFGKSSKDAREAGLISDDISKQIEDNKKRIENYQDLAEAHQREITLLNAERDAFRDYELAQQVKDFGFIPAFKANAEQLHAQIRDLKEVIGDFEGQPRDFKINIQNQLFTKSELLNLITYKEAQEKTFNVLTTGINKSEALARAQKLIADSANGFTKAMAGGPQAFAQWREELENALQTVSKFKDKDEKAIDSVKRLQEELSNLTGRFDELKFSESNIRDSKIAGDITELRSMLAIPVGQPLNVDILTNYRNEISTKRLPDESAAKYESRLKSIVEIMKVIDNLLQLWKERDTVIDTLEKSKAERQLEVRKNMQSLQLEFNKLELSKTLFSTDDLTVWSQQFDDILHGKIDSIDTINAKMKEIKSRQAPEGGEEDLKNQIEFLTYQQKKTEYAKQLLSILQQVIALPSATWGDAWVKQLIKLQHQTEAWRDELSSTIVTAGGQLITSTFSQITDFKGQAEYNQQLADEKFRLTEIQASIGDVNNAAHQRTIINDQVYEQELKIKQLEDARANVYRDILLKAISDVFDKLKEMASQKIIAGIISLGDPQQNEKVKAMEKEVEGATIMLTLDTADLAIAIKRLAIETAIRKQKGGSSGSGADVQGFGGFGDILNLGFGILSHFATGGGGANIGGGVGGSGQDIGVGTGLYGKTAPSGFQDLRRPITNNTNQTTHNTPIVFNGDVYGTDSFDRHVDRAVKAITKSRI